MSFGHEKSLNENLPIVMKNELARGKYSMDLTERRLLYVAMSKIHPDDIEFGSVNFTLSEYMRLLEKNMQSETLKGGNTYTAIKSGCEALLKRIVKIQQGKIWTAFQWVSRARVDEGTGEISLKFHDEMKPYLLWMTEEVGFTKFLLKYALPLQSIYAQRFYEMFRGMVYDNNNSVVHRMKLDDLRAMLELENKYPNFNDLNRKVIEPAEREINGKTDLMISFKEIRSKARGKKITALNVHLQLKSALNTSWGSYMLWDPADLALKASQIASKRTGQNVDPDTLLIFKHEPLARLVSELKDESLDLSTIKNCQAFFVFKLHQWSDDLGMRQIKL